MIKASLSIGILLVGISVSYYIIFAWPAIQKQRLAVQIAGAQVEHDQQCSKAAKVFWDDNPQWDAGYGYGYDHTNHFNSKLNRCFMLVSRITIGEHAGYTADTSKLLLDVNEGTTIGQIQDRVTGGEEDIPLCDMLDKRCKTEDEFDAFVKSYMEQ